MTQMLHVFVFGVVVPTVITVAVFIGFLFCWFKLGVRDRFAKQRSAGTTRRQQSACSSDSLCDMTGSTSCGSDVTRSVCVQNVNSADDASCGNERDEITREVPPGSSTIDRSNGQDAEGVRATVADCSSVELILSTDCSNSDNYGHVVLSARTMNSVKTGQLQPASSPLCGATHHPP